MSRRNPAGTSVLPAARSRAVAAAALLLLAASVAACGSSPATAPAGSAGAARPTADPGGSRPPDVDRTAAPASPGPTDPGATPGRSEAPGPSGTASATTGPAASGSTAGLPPGADACSGSAENRDFFAAAAEAMSWDVYCPVLPDGWFVETGAYRLADGGRLDITYRGPAGERLDLRQGAYCAGDAAACAPRTREIGPAAFGDRTGLLVALGGNDADGFAVYVDAGDAPAWALTGTGMDASGLAAIAAALHRVSE
jgi:hypothetical protein